MTRPSRCPTERFPTLTDAQHALLERRARANLNGAPPAVTRIAYGCALCGGAHITRDRHRGAA